MKKIKLITITVVFGCLLLAGCKKEEPCNHTYNNGIVKTEATCVSEGEMVYICSLCNKAKYEAIPITEHKYVENIEKKPTETEEGEKKFECEICKDTYSESIPKIVVEHKLGDKEMPYSFDDTIYIEKMTDLYDYYHGGATIKLSNYDKEKHTFELNIKLDDTGEQGSIEPFGDYAIIVTYVSENYEDIGFTTDTTDPNCMDLLYCENLSLHAGGEGDTYIFSYNIEESGEEPKYITFYTYDYDDVENWVWVELPK